MRSIFYLPPLLLFNFFSCQVLWWFPCLSAPMVRSSASHRRAAGAQSDCKWIVGPKQTKLPHLDSSEKPCLWVSVNVNQTMQAKSTTKGPKVPYFQMISFLIPCTPCRCLPSCENIQGLLRTTSASDRQSHRAWEKNQTATCNILAHIRANMKPLSCSAQRFHMDVTSPREGYTNHPCPGPMPWVQPALPKIGKVGSRPQTWLQWSCHNPQDSKRNAYHP